jgi:hypothetical protein
MLPIAAGATAAGIDNPAATATGEPYNGRVVVGAYIVRGAPSRGLGRPHRGLQCEPVGSLSQNAAWHGLATERQRA